MTIRKLAQSLGPYYLAAAVLPGGLIIAPLFFLLRRRNPAVQAAIQRVLVALLFVAYPAIADIPTGADPRPGATKGSLQQQLFPAANEADEPDVMDYAERFARKIAATIANPQAHAVPA